MRGEDAASVAKWWQRFRITPACAGKTRRPYVRRRSQPDHPRMRGEDKSGVAPVGKGRGSPPHARGRLLCSPISCPTGMDHPRMRGEDGQRRPRTGLMCWITPACAGKTNSHVRRRVVRVGLPPHARGRPGCTGPPPHAGRITPACAGKTPTRREMDLTVTDHPRMRGEDIMVEWRSRASTGSPPHARGRPDRQTVAGNPLGITPACAGKTPHHSHPSRTIRDHPRMRGEDAAYDSKSSSACGSPPHARGRRRRSCRFGNIPWITPACAGKTSGRSTPKSRPRDHPRMRGEDVDVLAVLGTYLGSPPHARGRLRVARPRSQGRGITPACAGKT